jgi:hypothetical protein
MQQLRELEMSMLTRDNIQDLDQVGSDAILHITLHMTYNQKLT